MTQEDKELLFKDLCARLPYNVICQVEFRESGKYQSKSMFLSGVFTDEAYFTTESGSIYSNEYKPYLFPLSSMTDEQKKHITDRWGINEDFNFEIDPNWGEYIVELGDTINFINWLNENRFDINNLIPKGLAIDATGLNIYDKAKMNF